MPIVIIAAVAKIQTWVLIPRHLSWTCGRQPGGAAGFAWAELRLAWYEYLEGFEGFGGICW